VAVSAGPSAGRRRRRDDLVRRVARLAHGARAAEVSAEVGVTSRGELVARLSAEHSEPGHPAPTLDRRAG
jgi:hypothetical protein